MQVLTNCNIYVWWSGKTHPTLVTKIQMLLFCQLQYFLNWESMTFAGHKPDASKLKLMRTSRGHVKGTLTIPVIATDTVSDLKRKLKRTLAPLIERNLSVTPTQAHQPFGETMMRTPGKSPMRTPPRNHFSDDMNGRKLGTPESKAAGVRSLSFSKLRNLSPNPKASPNVEPGYSSPGLPRSGSFRKPVEEYSVSAAAAPPSAKKLSFTSKTESSADLSSTTDLVRNTTSTCCVLCAVSCL